MKTIAPLCLVALILCLTSCAPQAAEVPDTRAADEAAIRANVREWSAAAQAKDLEKFVSFYAEDATLMLEQAPDLSGKTALRDGIGQMMQDPAFALSFELSSVDVARSGDLAYETGTFSLTTTNPETKQPATEKGHYVVVWKKQADGSWKVVRDVPVSDPAEASGQ